ncbi:hypothetical protein RM553_05185 [Zunongwangia sp. F363]|uniref:Bacteriocin-type signal sequence n=1 Tax=Autumnicola tepida TaxID=3075595 RepID=A0ABU3C7Q2_9FLAO|nr:hypothetical protein [Zunongwangia sp. F363]MDT0642222.1 hypothetical protein [Zunongwangia sp. F363]
MKNLHLRELEPSEIKAISGGGPIKDFLDWEIRTKFSIYRGIWDGLIGNEPAV